jgi:hypothetical protein
VLAFWVFRQKEQKKHIFYVRMSGPFQGHLPAEKKKIEKKKKKKKDSACMQAYN